MPRIEIVRIHFKSWHGNEGGVDIRHGGKRYSGLVAHEVRQRGFDGLRHHALANRVRMQCLAMLWQPRIVEECRVQCTILIRTSLIKDGIDVEESYQRILAIAGC